MEVEGLVYLQISLVYMKLNWTIINKRLDLKSGMFVSELLCGGRTDAAKAHIERVARM